MSAPDRRHRDEHTLRRRASDALSQMSSVGLIVICVVGFLGPAIAGVSLVTRLGGAGWVMYALVLSTWALVFGPIIASAVKIHQSGSPRHREAKRQRIEEQRRKFGLHLRQAEADQEPPAPPAQDPWKPGEGL